MPKLRRPIDPRLQNQICHMEFDKAYVAWEFLCAIVNGPNPEIACFGARGDAKTSTALAGMIEHSKEHHRRGFTLPVPWVGVTDTFTSHKMKTVKTMENPIWMGGWRLSDGDHVATYMLAGSPMVRIDLFGIEDQGAMDRMRMETVGMWFEEPAPSAVMVQSSGISEEAWNLGMTSKTSGPKGRIPSHFGPAIATLNYPDEDHWTWRRWVVKKQSGSIYFRIPPGERASAEDRADWARALADRPDMLRRLLEGQPGVIMLGQQVAQGFDYDHHISKTPLLPKQGEPLIFGFDFGHTPTCIIGQQNGATLEEYASLFLENSGMRQLMEEKVMPWLGRYAPWVLRDPDSHALIGYDPSGDTTADADAEHSALKVIQEILDGGNFESGPVRWPNRRNALSIFHRIKGIQFDPVGCEDLIKACNGRWYYPKTHQGDVRSDLPKKPNHPWEDLGDGLIYQLCRAGTVSWNQHERNDVKVFTEFNVFA